jgi:hypothetical protein
LNPATADMKLPSGSPAAKEYLVKCAFTCDEKKRV